MGRSAYPERVRTVLMVLGILLGLGGVVWIAQGLNLPFAPRSFMTAEFTAMRASRAVVMTRAMNTGSPGGGDAW